MRLIEVITLAMVQGLTELLPVSSSAHLILLPILLGWSDQGLSFDVAVHLGTLLAVCVYFRKPLRFLCQGFYRLLLGKPSRFYSVFAWKLVIATLPIALLGYLARNVVASLLRAPWVIASSTIGFGIVLWLSDRFTAHTKKLSHLSWRDTLLIGLAQALALIPGASRSGLTLSAGLFLGYHRTTSATFSFLLSIPVILLASAYEGYQMLSSPPSLPGFYLALGVGCAAISAYACIHLFLRLLDKIGVVPFVLYRLVLGLLLLLFL